MLAVDGVEVLYDRIIVALRGVSLVVPDGEIVALLGANGAGKSTTLKAVAGLLPAERGAITRGTIRLGERDVTGAPARTLAAAGVVLVPEGRRCFPHLSVEENLIAGALVRRPSRAALALDLTRVYGWFPRLADRRKSAAGYLSGGEQQMLAFGRALMARPKLVLLDEPSMGLAPSIVEDLFRIMKALNERDGTSFLLAEQNATAALRFAHHGYILENGRVVAGGTAAELSAREDVKEFYLGVGTHSREHLHETRTRQSA
ncbi:MAG: ABC transporter ATP-binding protein [Polyangia bacterium]